MCGGFLIRVLGDRIRQVFELLLAGVKNEASLTTSQSLKTLGFLGLAVTNDQLRGVHRHHRKRAGLWADDFAGAAIDAERHLDG